MVIGRPCQRKDLANRTLGKAIPCSSWLPLVSNVLLISSTPRRQSGHYNQFDPDTSRNDSLIIKQMNYVVYSVNSLFEVELQSVD
jgi:hypothetical protein